MAITDDVLASTLESMRDDAVDNLFVATPWLDACDKKGGIVPVEQIDGGRRLTVPILVQNHSTSVDLSTETSALSLAFSDVLEDASYVWAHNVAPVFLGAKVAKENQGDAAKVSVLETRMKRVLKQMRDELNQKAISNRDPITGTTASKFADLTTMNGFTASGVGRADGIFEVGAFGAGTQDNTVGGVSKSSYPTAWCHQYETAGGAFGTSNAGMGALDMLIGDCEKYTPMGGKPSLVLMSRSGWQNLRRALRASGAEFYEGASDVKEFGYGKLIYNGVPVDYDPNLENDGGTTTSIISAYVLNLDHIKLYHLKDAWFNLSDWTSGLFGGFAGEGCYVHTAVALAPDHLASSGVLVHADSY